MQISKDFKKSNSKLVLDKNKDGYEMMNLPRLLILKNAEKFKLAHFKLVFSR